MPIQSNGSPLALNGLSILMPISIYSPSSRNLKSIDTQFALQQDDWDDYSYRTLYHLYYRPSASKPDKVKYIGGVKILKRDQETGPQLIQKPFTRLGRGWVSVGTSLDYYQRLNEIPIKHREKIMSALQDAVAIPELIEEFQNETGWKTSIFRNTSNWNKFLSDARVLYEGNFSALVGMEDFSFLPKGATESIDFNFEAPVPPDYCGSFRRIGPSRKKVLLPERIVVLVGRNGSGKSTILSRLAHLAYASPQERNKKELLAMGEITPASIGFMRVVTISYSAFDSFVVPGLAEKDLNQIVKDIDNGDSRFVFCGLRDIVGEVSKDLARAESKPESVRSRVSMDRRSSTELKPIDALANEFIKLLKTIIENKDENLFKAAIEPLMTDPSFRDFTVELDELLNSTRLARKYFMQWSTGHKIALHVIASLVAHTRPQSLVLFDEPETHLHPPLMAALMHSVRLILTEVNAYCVVATHSPVLLQETLARHVRYVERNGSTLTITAPTLETYGENIGILTYDSFGLTAASTDYHAALDLLAAEYDTLKEIDTIFEFGLSAQARAYVLSKMAKRRLAR
jgi:predicted ATPase